MPSGAKKRKAIKKKKEKETHTSNSSSSSNNNNNPQVMLGNNDVSSDGGAPSVQPVVSVDKSAKGVSSDVESIQSDNAVRIERELKEDSKSAKGSSNGDDRSSSSSSSSSDDESRVVERRRKEDAHASFSGEKPNTESVRPVNSSPPEVIQATEDTPAGKAASSATESTPVVDSVKHGVSAPLTENKPVVGAVTSNDVVKMGLENGAHKVLPTETANASSSVVESVSNGNESKLSPPLGTSLAQVSNDAESIEESEIPVNSEKQPLVAPAPPVPQKTSCFSCCGILDVITGSSR